MAYLFNDITEFKTYIGGAGNASLRLNSLEPIMQIAAEKHLVPWLSSTELQTLVDDFGALDPEYILLLPYVQKPLALLTMYEYAKVGGIQFGENGIFRLETESQKSAYKYQENQFSRFMLESGYDAIERLLNFLDENSTDYPVWTASEAFARHRSLLLNTAVQFREAYTSDLSRYTFEVLRPIIRDIEDFAIKGTIGSELYGILKAGILAANLTTARKALLKVIHNATASFAIEEGMKRQWVQFSGKDIVQNEKLEPQSYQKEASPGMATLNVSTQHAEDWGNRHIVSIKAYLLENIDDFPEYQTYLDEQAAEEETSAEAEEFADRYFLSCGCHTICTCSSSSTSNKGIVRF